MVSPFTLRHHHCRSGGGGHGRGRGSGRGRGGRGGGDVAKLCVIKSARIEREKKTHAPVLESLRVGAGVAHTACVSEELG